MELPPEYAKRYLRKAPAAKLARLAVTSALQRQGFGGLMMVDAMRRTLAAAKNIKFISFLVDTRNQGAHEYSKQSCLVALPDHPLSLFMPLVTLASAVETLSQ